MENIYNAIQNVYNMDKTTWQEVLAELYNLVYKVENKFDLFETKFGQLLGEELTIKLKKMYDDGSLAALINDKLLKEVSEKLDNNTNELKKIKTFEIFPSDEELINLNLDETFEVKGFYVEGDINKCLYKKVSYSQNALQKNGFCIKPITNCSNKKIYLPFIGIKEGKENSEKNSTILSNLSLAFGTTLELPDGHFYFKNTIDLKSKQCSLKGNYITFTSDLNTGGITFLHFEELKEGEKAITLATGGLSNIVVVGNKEDYNYNINREQTYINPQSIENEICNKKITGIYGGSTTTLENVYVKNFYKGCYLESGNIYINNFFARNCHYGLSIGNDTKCMGVFGFDVHTLLQIRGSISSAVQVRGDSVHHLVNICGGNTSGVHLTALDGDFCVGSVLTIGEHDVWGTVSNLVINGITGRFCAYNAYDKSVDEVPTSNNITDSSDISNWAFISVYQKNNLDGAYITTSTSLSSNLMDKASNYYTPPILMAGGANCKIIACINTMYGSYYATDGSIKINRELLLNTFKFFSSNTNNTRIAINTPSNVYYYHKPNPNTINITRGVTESLS